ncbi:Phage antirepressor protein KilAC domain protein [Fructobacillus sp. EFB-N1]|uniref:phage antirepressor KilAC domain-containing protein n=1 Tax=Fructobacillus sp. EFB-N1 TaxID=1658766 RepID=UPI00064DECED|nr:phage antirepressor [Fructobacillus sp. EFB-N1]KMK53280.1 Phage antirepressor protein KilAC domain protein [Fructobacillus sp. EFB-N1]
MANEVKAFNFESNEVRTVLIDNEPWFVGKDVADTLGYSDPNKAIQMHVDIEDKKLNDKTSLSFGQRGAHLINESGVYSLIFGSKLDSAKRFKKWVTSEVLPSIRKHGAYMTDAKAEALITNRDNTLSDLLIQAGEQLKAKDLQISEMKPKALFADAVDTSTNSVLIGQLAKIIKQNGVEIGQNRLFSWLREHGYLVSRGEQRNLPTQKSLSLEIMETKTRTINNPDGSVRTTSTPKVTGKGQIYFVNKFLEAKQMA